MSLCDPNDRLIEAYRRERLSVLPYVRQAVPYAGPADRPLLDRVRELADAEAAALDGFVEFLDSHRVLVPYVGAFPTAFTNYNFIAIRKLIPELIVDERRGLEALQTDIAALPDGEPRARLVKLADEKRMHLTELEKLVDKLPAVTDSAEQPSKLP